jgi:hypothetical protein
MRLKQVSTGKTPLSISNELEYHIGRFIENVNGSIILIYNCYFYSVVIYLALRALERCACFKSTNTAAGVIPSILLAAPCDSKGKILISFKLIAPEI